MPPLAGSTPCVDGLGIDGRSHGLLCVNGCAGEKATTNKPRRFCPSLSSFSLPLFGLFISKHTCTYTHTRNRHEVFNRQPRCPKHSKIPFLPFHYCLAPYVSPLRPSLPPPIHPYTSILASFRPYILLSFLPHISFLPSFLQMFWECPALEMSLQGVIRPVLSSV